MSHFVDRPIAPSDPLIGIGIALVGDRVVVPGFHVNDRAFGQNRRVVIREDVVGHPVEVEFADIGDGLDGAIRQDRFERHGRAAKVHVRLIVFKTRRRS